MQASTGQAGPVYKSRADKPYWKSDPNFQGMVQNILRSVWPGYPGPFSAAAVEVQAQYILCDMAGRAVTPGGSPRPAPPGGPRPGRGGAIAPRSQAARRPRTPDTPR